VFDDDHYYMGGVLAELLVKQGCDVTLITPAPRVSEWAFNTLEQGAIHQKLANLGVKVVLNRGMASINSGSFISNCMFTDKTVEHPCDSVVMVASRLSNNSIFHELIEREAEWADAGIKTVKVIADAEAPGPIAWATYAGHRYARELDVPVRVDTLSFRREITELQTD
jgi:dimethylamine/trimethylamine dehydrogenase